LKIWAFIKRDFLEIISYRFQLLLSLGNMLIALLLFFYIGKIFSGSVTSYLAPYGGDYFSYVLVGLAVSNFVTVGLGTLSSEIRSAQVEGTLEALISTPTSIYIILVGSSLWSFITAFGVTILILIFGAIALNFYITVQTAFLALLILLLTFTAFLAIGMLSASFIMIFKQGNPINMIFGTLSYFLGGVLFPVETLPDFLQTLSGILPLTHSIKALRDLLLANKDLGEIGPVLINLVFFILLLAPLSIFFFQFAIKKAKREGTLIHY
jgi:ABC-2 type transport system permease protein